MLIFSPAKLIVCIALLVPLMLSSGCSTLPGQTLHLHPEIKTTAKFPREKRFDLQIKDLRSNEIVGFRHKDGKNQGAIILQDSLALLTDASKQALLQMGIHQFVGGEYNLQISLLKLSYQAEKRGLKQQVDLDMKMKIKLEKGNKNYTANYASHKQHQFIKTPDEQENEKIIGELVSETLNRAFNDPQIINFVQFN